MNFENKIVELKSPYALVVFIARLTIDPLIATWAGNIALQQFNIHYTLQYWSMFWVIVTLQALWPSNAQYLRLSIKDKKKNETL